MATKSPELSGVVGFYNSPEDLLEGMRKVRESKFELIDAFTPFPVHGLDDVQGLRRSRLPYITFIFGLTGAVCGFALQYWTSAQSWALNVGGRPFNSWPAFIPVTFELTILFAGISTFIGMLAINRLPNISKRAFDPSITRDRFAIWIGAPKKDSASFSEADAKSALQASGAQEVQTVYEEGWF